MKNDKKTKLFFVILPPLMQFCHEEACFFAACRIDDGICR